jgi:hypothetical protein
MSGKLELLPCSGGGKEWPPAVLGPLLDHGLRLALSMGYNRVAVFLASRRKILSLRMAVLSSCLDFQTMDMSINQAMLSQCYSLHAVIRSAHCKREKCRLLGCYAVWLL